MGTVEGSPITDPETKEFKKDNLGQTIVSKLNEPLLRQLAAVNGGLYGNLENTDEMLKEVTTIINQLEKKGVEGEVSNTNYNNYFFWFLTAAFLLLMIELFIRERKKA